MAEDKYTPKPEHKFTVVIKDGYQKLEDIYRGVPRARAVAGYDEQNH